MTTHITVIDRPCGVGKSTDLIAEIKRHRVNNPDAQILLVLPELGEVKRFLDAIGDDWLTAPLVENSSADNKTDVLIELLSKGRNVITTHALYERIRKFQHLLTGYHVVIDEVPTAAKEVSTNFGRGVFKHLLHEKQYISIDPVTKLITADSSWYLDKDDYSSGSDIDIRRFMNTVVHTDVYHVNDTFQVMPLPEAFFTRPKSLTIMTFLFEGTQLDYYMRSRGYKYQLQISAHELAQFKREMRKNLCVCLESTKIRAGYAVMTEKNPKARKTVGNFMKNILQYLRSNGVDATPDRILVASSKDAWYGKDENPNSKVSNLSRLKTLARLGNATYTSMITRGTNKFRDLDILVLMGKVNMNPGLAEFLGMRTRKAQDHHALSELIQLIYRTAIRDNKVVLFISADKENIRLISEFLRP